MRLLLQGDDDFNEHIIGQRAQVRHQVLLDIVVVGHPFTRHEVAVGFHCLGTGNVHQRKRCTVFLATTLLQGLEKQRREIASENQPRTLLPAQFHAGLGLPASCGV